MTVVKYCCSVFKKDKEHEYKIINKQLMATRDRDLNGNWTSWQFQGNVFEIVKAYLLWRVSKAQLSDDWLPHYVLEINEDSYPDLRQWYDLLSSPNSPYKRVLKVSEQEFKEWIIGLDFTKPIDKKTCDKMFEIVLNSTKRDVDAVAIAENENLGDV